MFVGWKSTKKSQKSMQCRTCLIPDSYENETHLLNCSGLKDKFGAAESKYRIENIYGTLESQVEFIKYFEKIHMKQKLMLEL